MREASISSLMTRAFVGAVVVSAALFASACENPGTTDPGTMDAGETDSGTTDAGETDSGTMDPDMDAGETDSGTTDPGMDAGETDAGETDAGPVDAGEADAGTPDAGPADAGETDPANPTTIAGEVSVLTELANALARFKADTSRWPLGSGTWDDLRSNISPEEFSEFFDVALYVKPAGFRQCETTRTTEPCWDGPYLEANGARPTGLDAWGRRRLFAYLAPELAGGGGEGAPNAPDGAILVWSRGPNEVDDTGCLDGNCAVDLVKLAIGSPSTAEGDDIIVLVGTAR